MMLDDGELCVNCGELKQNHQDISIDEGQLEDIIPQTPNNLILSI
jgi:hypothetical protein